MRIYFFISIITYYQSAPHMVFQAFYIILALVLLYWTYLWFMQFGRPYRAVQRMKAAIDKDQRVSSSMPAHVYRYMRSLLATTWGNIRDNVALVAIRNAWARLGSIIGQSTVGSRLKIAYAKFLHFLSKYMGGFAPRGLPPSDSEDIDLDAILMCRW